MSVTVTDVCSDSVRTESLIALHVKIKEGQKYSFNIWIHCAFTKWHLNIHFTVNLPYPYHTIYVGEFLILFLYFCTWKVMVCLAPRTGAVKYQSFWMEQSRYVWRRKWGRELLCILCFLLHILTVKYPPGISKEAILLTGDSSYLVYTFVSKEVHFSSLIFR